MRKILLLLCILSITISAKAQYKYPGTSIIPTVIKESTGWKEGWYYDLQGEKHTGLIEISYTDKGVFKNNPGYIDFKTAKKEKSTKVLHTELKSVVLRGDTTHLDSFVITAYEDLKNKPFLKVYFARGKDAIYVSRVYRSVGLGVGSLTKAVGVGLTFPVDTYYFGTDPNDVIKLSGKRFKETMSKLMADKPWVVKKIKDSTFTSNNMDDLFYYYTTDKMPASLIMATE